jgi:hydroxymethylglutaryl-CoA synthase
MRGILSCAGYVPYRRLQLSEIAEFLGGAPVRGTRSVASFDEDTTTMAVEAARIALRSSPLQAAPRALWFATAEPAYLDRTNATAIHAALRLDSDAIALDTGSAVRSGIGPVLVVSSGMRTGLPTSPDEANGGDGAAAVLVGADRDGPLVAELLGAGSVTEEFLDRWRAPGDVSTRHWEDRFGETRYVSLGERAWNEALKSAGLGPEQVDVAVVTGVHDRSTRALARRLGAVRVAGDLSGMGGNTGAAHPALLLTAALEEAQPGQVVAVVSLADGADVLVFRATEAVLESRADRAVQAQIERGATVSYGKFLTWRRMLQLEPPNRPSPSRPSASAAARTQDWKFAFVGSRDRSTGIVHLPPSRIGIKGGEPGDMDPAPMADVPGTIVTSTVDRLIYSESPPVVFAVIDFDGGGRFASEMTDVDAGEVSIGQRVEMTFRRMFTADGIHNYFWKARPARY